MKKTVLILFLIAVAAISVYAENTIELKKADLIWSLEGDALTVSLEAKTKGWIAVGLGSARMDGSIMFIGFNDDGEENFEEHLGDGHRHKKTAVQRPVEYTVTENDGVTKLEFTVKKSDFVKTGQNSLPVIVAYGSRDNFTSLHRYRDSTVINF